MISCSITQDREKSTVKLQLKSSCVSVCGGVCGGVGGGIYADISHLGSDADLISQTDRFLTREKEYSSVFPNKIVHVYCFFPV